MADEHDDPTNPLSGLSQRQHAVITAQLNALKDEMHSRFESMESLLTQRIRHGDDNTKVVMEMLMTTMRDIQTAQREHDIWAKAELTRFDTRVDTLEKEHETRFRHLEDKQLSWTSSAKVIGGMIGMASALTGLAGTLVGMNL